MVTCLEREFVPKMEAEFLVLVDVLRSPSQVFGSHSVEQIFDTRLLERLIRHTKHSLDNSSKSFDMCIKLIKIFRQMLSLNVHRIQDKQVKRQEQQIT